MLCGGVNRGISPLQIVRLDVYKLDAEHFDMCFSATHY